MGKCKKQQHNITRLSCCPLCTGVRGQIAQEAKQRARSSVFTNQFSESPRTVLSSQLIAQHSRSIVYTNIQGWPLFTNTGMATFSGVQEYSVYHAIYRGTGVATFSGVQYTNIQGWPLFQGSRSIVYTNIQGWPLFQGSRRIVYTRHPAWLQVRIRTNSKKLDQKKSKWLS